MKTAILLAAYGSTVPAAQDFLEGLRSRILALQPELECRVACTSRQVLNRNDGADSPWRSVSQSLSDLAGEGFTRVAVQSLHVIPGSEYQEVLRAARASRKSGELELVSVGRPLLSSRDDVREVAGALLRTIPPLDPGHGVVVVAHGSAHPGRLRLEELLTMLEDRGQNLFTVTLESDRWRALPDQIQRRGLRKVWLLPLLLAPGRHLQRDILGPEPESLASMLSEREVDSEVLHQGMAAREEVASVWIDHLDAALEKIRAPSSREKGSA